MTSLEWHEFDSFITATNFVRDFPGRASGQTIFALQKPTGDFRFVLANKELVGRVCLGLCNAPGLIGEHKLRRHCHEVISDFGEPVSLFARFSYSLRLNPHLDLSKVIDTAIKYTRRTIHALCIAQRLSADQAYQWSTSVQINVETRTNAEQGVVFILKAPRMVMTNMVHQRSFWRHFREIVDDDRNRLDSRFLTAITPAGRAPMLVSAVYQTEKPTLFCTLAAASNDEEALHFITLRHRQHTSITLDEWLNSLIARRSDKQFSVPDEWLDVTASSTEPSLFAILDAKARTSSEPTCFTLPSTDTNDDSTDDEDCEPMPPPLPPRVQKFSEPAPLLPNENKRERQDMVNRRGRHLGPSAERARAYLSSVMHLLSACEFPNSVPIEEWASFIEFECKRFPADHQPPPDIGRSMLTQWRSFITNNRYMNLEATFPTCFHQSESRRWYVSDALFTLDLIFCAGVDGRSRTAYFEAKRKHGTKRRPTDPALQRCVRPRSMKDESPLVQDFTQ